MFMKIIILFLCVVNLWMRIQRVFLFVMRKQFFLLYLLFNVNLPVATGRGENSDESLKNWTYFEYGPVLCFPDKNAPCFKVVRRLVDSFLSSLELLIAPVLSKEFCKKKRKKIERISFRSSNACKKLSTHS